MCRTVVSAPHVRIEEASDFLECFARLRRVRVHRILGVGQGFEDLKCGLDACLSQLAMGACRQTEKQISGA